MSLSSPILFAGVQSVDFVSKSTGLPLGRLRVLQSVELANEITKTDLTGGALKAPWSTIEGASTTNLSITTNEYPSWLVDLATGGTRTDRSAEATGAVSSLTNSVGTTVSAGVAVTATGGAESALKTGRYYLKATGSDTLSVYLAGANVDGSAFSSDDLAIFTVDLSASPVVNATYGLTFTDNTADFTISDVAYFDVRAINVDSYNVKFGAETDTLDDVEIYVAGQLTSGKQAVLHVYRGKGGGMPVSFAPNTFSEYTLEFSCMYCASLGGTHEIDYIDNGSSGVC